MSSVSCSSVSCTSCDVRNKVVSSTCLNPHASKQSQQVPYCYSQQFLACRETVLSAGTVVVVHKSAEGVQIETIVPSASGTTGWVRYIFYDAIEILQLS